MAKKTSLEKLLGYQTRLQGVANDLATKLRELLDAADDETLAMLRREYKTATGDVKSRIRAIQKLVVALEKARAASFAEAETLVVETGRSVAEIASDATLAEIFPLLNAAERLDAERSKRRAAEVEERRRRLKPLSAKQIDAILNWSPIQDASISQWFERWRENDLRRIVDEVQTGAVESLSVYELTRKIRGTKANGYADGILQTSRRSAETVARTVINGVSNEARFATLCENDDVLDGIQFLATLDGRTSFVCASLDGKIWRGDEMEKAARERIETVAEELEEAARAKAATLTAEVEETVRTELDELSLAVGMSATALIGGIEQEATAKIASALSSLKCRAAAACVSVGVWGAFAAGAWYWLVRFVAKCWGNAPKYRLVRDDETSEPSTAGRT